MTEAVLSSAPPSDGGGGSSRNRVLIVGGFLVAVVVLVALVVLTITLGSLLAAGLTLSVLVLPIIVITAYGVAERLRLPPIAEGIGSVPVEILRGKERG